MVPRIAQQHAVKMQPRVVEREPVEPARQPLTHKYRVVVGRNKLYIVQYHMTDRTEMNGTYTYLSAPFLRKITACRSTYIRLYHSTVKQCYQHIHANQRILGNIEAYM